MRVYRLSSSRYPVQSGRGAALHGGRWNPKGFEVIYAAGSRALAALEVLVHYGALPKDLLLTPNFIPDEVPISEAPAEALAKGWDSPIPRSETQEYGRLWIESQASAVLCVPSAVIHGERNYVINVAHPCFARITFERPEPFEFDPRLAAAFPRQTPLQ